MMIDPPSVAVPKVLSGVDNTTPYDKREVSYARALGVLVAWIMFRAVKW